MYNNIEKSFSKDRHVLGEEVPLTTPYTILIDISDTCNLKCNYCFRSDDRIKAEDYRHNTLMNWETFTRVIDQICEFPEQIKRIALSHNGEPLCNMLLPQMIKYIKSKGLVGKTDIHTNGLLLNKEYIDKICEAGLDRMVISLQGLDDESYFKTCGVHIDFERFYRNIQYLFKKKKKTEVHIKIVSEALNNENDFYEKFSPYADRVFVEHVVPLWNGKEQECGDFEKNKYGDYFEVQKCCPLLFYVINVLPDGTIYPCSHIRPPFKLNNVFDSSLIKEWNSKKRKDFLKDMLIYGRFGNPNCKGCYIPQNTVMTKEDSIDTYSKEILKRIK